MTDEQLQTLGANINAAFDNRDIDALEKAICDCDAYRNDATNQDEIAALDYFTGNAYSNIDLLKHHDKESIWQYERAEQIKAIKYYRKCVANDKISEQTKTNFIQVYTNLGNIFSESGRTIYAIELWQRALDIDPDFGMAGGNRCKGLVYYADILYDQSHRAIFYRYSYKLFPRFIDCKSISPEDRKLFLDDFLCIEKSLDKNFLDAEDDFTECSLGETTDEKIYRKWVLASSLYLNPLNDILFYTAVAHDVLHLPNMIVKTGEFPVFHGFFNEIKQTFITARYLHFSHLKEENDVVHYSDTDRHLLDTRDYSLYGYKYELLKNAFKMCYSIFDKIAYFVNEYFDLGVDKDRVSFRNVWYRDGAINPKLEPLSKLKNNPLRGLYFLSKDFLSKDDEYLEVADCDAQKIAEIRNHLEHKYCKIHSQEVNKSDTPVVGLFAKFDSLSYSITEKELQDKTYRLLKTAREAIIYLSLAVHNGEEKRREANQHLVTLSLAMREY